MPEFKIVSRIAAKGVRSLVWHKDDLMDWVGGGVRFDLIGQQTMARKVYYAYRFDAACSSPSGEYTVIYERLGTKGLVLREGKLLREIDRSYYFANAYEFPVCFARLKSGKEVLIHCPSDYNQIDIDDVETGERLTSILDRKPMDCFHSRLSVDCSGTYLMSAGWVWHPLDVICLFRLEAAIEDPRSLDDSLGFPRQPSELGTAAFLGADRLVIASSEEAYNEEFQENEIRTSSICLWDIPSAKILSQVELEEPAGTLMPLDEDFAVGFFQHPKIISLKTGKIVQRIEDLNSGKQTSSIIHHHEAIPPMAIDATRKRFAIASEDEIVVVELEN